VVKVSRIPIPPALISTAKIWKIWRRNAMGFHFLALAPTARRARRLIDRRPPRHKQTVVAFAIQMRDILLYKLLQGRERPWL
jgi:hypothetical protein